MKIGINNPGKSTLIISVQLLLFLKWMSKKYKSGWSVFANIYYDKRRKVVCYQRFKEEVLNKNRLALER